MLEGCGESVKRKFSKKEEIFIEEDEGGEGRKRGKTSFEIFNFPKKKISIFHKILFRVSQKS